LGYELPLLTNPAEYLIDIVSIDNRNAEAEKIAGLRVDRITQAWREYSSNTLNEKDAHTSNVVNKGSPTSGNAQHTSFLQQTRVLTARTWVVTVRDPMGMIGSLVEAIGMVSFSSQLSGPCCLHWHITILMQFLKSIITGWIFLQLDGSLSGIRSRQGALYTAAALQGYLVLLYETYRLTTDIQLFDEEARQGVVGIPAFLVSRRLARLFIEDVPVPLIFSLIFYFMSGFRTDGTTFLTFFSVILLEQYIAVCFATTCIAISRNFAGVTRILLSYRTS
jgi:hypothetical protein